MADIKANLEYLSQITGMECEKGNFDQISRVASNLYVDGHNYMMQNDWTLLDEEKLEQLCTDMKQALSSGSEKNVARLKWNDPLAPVFPIIPEDATEEQKEKIENYWAAYEEKRKQRAELRAGEGQAVQDVQNIQEDALRKIFAEEQNPDFWKTSTQHAFSNFAGGAGREGATLIREVLLARGMKEEDLYNENAKEEEKRAVVNEVREIIDKNNGLDMKIRVQKLVKLLDEVQENFYKKQLKPLDLNDIDCDEVIKHNLFVDNAGTALYQILMANRDKDPLIAERARKMDSVNKVYASFMDAERQRQKRTISVENVYFQNLIDGKGLAWNETYKKRPWYSGQPDAKEIPMNLDVDLEKTEEMDTIYEEYKEAESKEEQELSHQKLLEYGNPKKYMRELLEQLNEVDPIYLKSSKEFKALKTTLEKAADAKPCTIEVMEKVYESANSYIMKKSGVPATGHGKERLNVARRIRDLTGAMVMPADGYYKTLELADNLRVSQKNCRNNEMRDFADRILPGCIQAKENEFGNIHNIKPELKAKLAGAYMDMEYQHLMNPDLPVSQIYTVERQTMRQTDKLQDKNIYREILNDYRENRVKGAETEEEKKGILLEIKNKSETITSRLLLEQTLAQNDNLVRILGSKNARAQMQASVRNNAKEKVSTWKEELKNEYKKAHAAEMESEKNHEKEIQPQNPVMK